MQTLSRNRQQMHTGTHTFPSVQRVCAAVPQFEPDTNLPWQPRPTAVRQPFDIRVCATENTTQHNMKQHKVTQHSLNDGHTTSQLAIAKRFNIEKIQNMQHISSNHNKTTCKHNMTQPHDTVHGQHSVWGPGRQNIWSMQIGKPSEHRDSC